MDYKNYIKVSTSLTEFDETSIFIKKKKSPTPKTDVKPLKFLDLFRYSDWTDKFLLLAGSLAGLTSACAFSLIFILFGYIVEDFVRLLQVQAKNDSHTINSTVSNETFGTSLQGTIKHEHYLILGLSSFLLSYIAYICINSSAERQIKRMKCILLKAVLKQDRMFFLMYNQKELTYTMNKNLNSLKLVLGFKLNEFIMSTGRVLACFIISVWSAWKLSLILASIVALVSVLIYLWDRKNEQYIAKRQLSIKSSHLLAKKILFAIETVMALGLQKKLVDSFKKHLKMAEIWTIHKGFKRGIFEGLIVYFQDACFTVFLLLSVYFYQRDAERFTPRMIVQAFFSMLFISNSLAGILSFLKEITVAKEAACKIFAIIETKLPEDRLDKKDIRIYNLKGEITFENIDFTYPRVPSLKKISDTATEKVSKSVFVNLNLTIPAGKTVAIVGESGSGKSTIFSLLQQILSPDAGEIKIDGVNVKDLDLDWLRNQMALVSQEPILFTTTIKENIRLGKLDATDYEIEMAAKSANAHTFIMNTPKQYDTQVGASGIQLSRGQKQRIAIARALLRNPKIFLLDESTWELDDQTERIVQEKLTRAHFFNNIGRTTIIIAQKLSTIKNADRIVVITEGGVKEQGTHDELMDLRGAYYKLVSSETIYDPLVRCRSSDSSSDSDSDDSEASIMTSSDPDRIAKNKSTKKHIFYYIREIFNLQASETPWIILGSVTQFISGAVRPLIYIYFSQIYRIFTIKNRLDQYHEGVAFAVYISILAVIHFFSVFISKYSFYKCEAKIVKRIRVRMFESILRQDMEFHDQEKNRPSNLLRKIFDLSHYCIGLCSNNISSLCRLLGTILFVIIFSLIYCPQLCVVFQVFCLTVLLNLVILEKMSVNKKKLFSRGNEKLLLNETIENFHYVSCYGLEDYLFKIFKFTIDEKTKAAIGYLFLKGLIFSFDVTMVFLLQFVVFKYGLGPIEDRQLGIVSLFEFYALLEVSRLMIAEVYAEIPEYKQARNAARVAYKIINRKPLIDSMAEDGIKMEKLVGDIEFKDVEFCYPTRPNIKILTGFNLLIKHGKTNALVGKSGCGKSTISSLILRFYDVTNGSILIDGKNIKNFNVQWLRSQIGVVSQEPVLFNMSIKDNILKGDHDKENIPLKELYQSLVNANILGCIENLPHKHDTIVGLQTDNLTIGEKQRIGLARALVRKPQVLISDVASSESEQLFQNALENAQYGRTCILLTSKVNTILYSELINVIYNGSILETSCIEKNA